MEVSSPPEYARTIVPFPMVNLLLNSEISVCGFSIYFQGDYVEKNSLGIVKIFFEQLKNGKKVVQAFS